MFPIEFHPSWMKHAPNTVNQISPHRCSQTVTMATVTTFKIPRKLYIKKSLPNLIDCLCEVLGGGVGGTLGRHKYAETRRTDGHISHMKLSAWHFLRNI